MICLQTNGRKDGHGKTYNFARYGGYNYYENSTNISKLRIINNIQSHITIIDTIRQIFPVILK
jgi:hypothetical protein